jgi:peroxiredoxin family protein
VEDNNQKDGRIVMNEKATLICSTHEFEKVYALFNIANGCASFGMDVAIFFTFDGLNLLKKDKSGTPLFLNEGFFGPDKEKMIQQMRTKEITSLKEQFKDVRELGTKLIACDMSMEMMGITKEELISGVEVGGIGTYVSEAKGSNITLFI